MSSGQTKTQNSAVLFCCYFLSGFGGLLFEILLIHHLGQILGRTPLALSLILAGFLGSMTLGLWLYRKFEKKLTLKPNRVYAFLELFTALAILLLPLTNWCISFLQTIFFPWLSANPGFGFFKVLINMVAYLPLALLPPLFMGATFAPISRAFRNEKRAIIILYTLNTLGAAIASLLGPLYFLPVFGFKGLYRLLVILNFAIFCIAFFSESQSHRFQIKETDEISDNHLSYPLIVSTFLNGMVILGLENYFSLVLAPLLGASSLMYCIVIFTFILGLFLGNWCGKCIENEKTSWLLFKQTRYVFIGYLLVLPLTWSFSPIILVSAFQSLKSFSNLILLQIGTGLAFCLLPAICCGLHFPSILRMKKISGDQGIILYFWGGLGAACGSLLTGLVLLPVLGSLATTQLLAFLVLLSLLFAEEKVDFSIHFFNWSQGLKMAGIFCIFFVFFMGNQLFFNQYGKSIICQGVFYRPERFFSHKSIGEKWDTLTQSKVVFYRESPLGVVSVHKQFGQTLLKINGKTDASDLNDAGDIRTQYLLAILPHVLSKRTAETLVVGLGSGATAHCAEEFVKVKGVDVLEIDPNVVLASRYFRHLNGELSTSPKVRIIYEDARIWLKYCGKKYDTIISEPSNPWVAGMASLYTLEHFQAVRQSLTDEGIFAQWIHSYEMSQKDFSSLITTFKETFPQARIYRIGIGDLLLIGSKSGNFLTTDEACDKLKDFSLKAQLWGYKLPPAKVLLQGLRLDAKRIFTTFIGKLHTDNSPALGYFAVKGLYAFDPEPLQTDKLFVDFLKIREEIFSADKEPLKRAELARSFSSLAESFNLEKAALYWLRESFKLNPASLETQFLISRWNFFKTGKFLFNADFARLKGKLRTQFMELCYRQNRYFSELFSEPQNKEEEKLKMLFALKTGRISKDILSKTVPRDSELFLLKRLNRAEKSTIPGAYQSAKRSWQEWNFDKGTRYLLKNRPGIALSFLQTAYDDGSGPQKYRINLETVLKELRIKKVGVEKLNQTSLKDEGYL
ncbi:hypothetical protein ACFL35_08150 [Candidatus Riflebacteria bacterium]